MLLSQNRNPWGIFCYYLCVSGTVMFLRHPILTALSLAGALALTFARRLPGRGRLLWQSAILFAVVALLNPLIYHNGATVLFVLNDNPVTWEALAYGLVAAGMIVSVLFWMRAFAQIMSGDKVMYLLGALSPKLALLLSMTLRYIPLLRAQTHKTNQVQRAMGLYREDTIPGALRGRARVFSVMASWALENGITTADSMEARGYGSGRRTSFSLYRFRPGDVVGIATVVGLFALVMAGAWQGALRFDYYPGMQSPDTSPWAVVAYVSYGILAFLPSLLQFAEDWKWKCLKSKI